MIEILHPVTDAARVAAVTDPASGFVLVDGWSVAEPELAALGLPTEPADVRYIVFAWRRAVVRLPAAAAYRRLRTDRNRHLITDAEQQAWATALIGVAGLSVGASALSVCSLTGATRFRIADPDSLGPSNLNRLVGSVCDLGVGKTTLAQRRVWEADPYSEVESFPDGCTAETASAFLGGGAVERLSVLLEETDDIAMKVDLRVRARAAGIPVVMVTDNGDNAILDVERFDRDPQYPLFHGLAGDLDRMSPAQLRDPAARKQLVGAIVGAELTERTRYSLSEVGRSLVSWPQLGTAATVAGAVAALAARQIVCGGDLPSGRYRVDLDRALETPVEQSIA
ncbi:ThiF family adenylyltransferase [Skermania piniformis]|uniref:ThiF family adenylyltransferase n=1 Tax=Skermania pinensis TaxID=39122 RepID=A0ABX8S9W2_9ACTN|nr:ThiF family adenylyltransferase [Skermania piniformis]QXQ12511.1 ThiF family adenylyltransferase [Skermania piniformis]